MAVLAERLTILMKVGLEIFCNSEVQTNAHISAPTLPLRCWWGRRDGELMRSS